MIGRSFAPLGDPTLLRPDGPGGPTSGVGQAIQTLSLRYPRVEGAGAIAPQALLTSPGSAGLPQAGIDPILDAILRGVLGGYAPPRQMAPSAPGGVNITAPPPRVTPLNPGDGTNARQPYTPPPPPVTTRPPRVPNDQRMPPGKRQGPDNFPRY